MRLRRGANDQPRAASIAAMAFACLLLACATAPAASAAPAGTASTTAFVQQPRPFGYVLGDTLTQRILLRPAGSEFQPESLPPAERAGLWFARRSSKIEKAEDDRRWLVIDYQLVNAPQTLITVNLPAVTLKSKAGTEWVVPPWPISVAPLTPRSAFATGGLQELRPDHPAPMLPTTMLRRQLEIWVIALAVTVVIWLGWWVVRALRAAAKSPWVDVDLVRINPIGAHMDADPDVVIGVLKEMKAAGKGIIGMKILGQGALRNRQDEALKFALGLNLLDAFTIGAESISEQSDLLRRISAVA